MASSDRPPASDATPTWEVARLFPLQGEWTEAEFLRLHTNRMAELADGHLEVLPMPTWLHQLIVDFLADALKQHLRTAEIGGRVLQAPLPVRLFPNTIREPDVMYFAPGREPEKGSSFPQGADLVIEVVSEGPDARRRDYEDKRRDYARAGIPEYWIVDPSDQRITVLSLRDAAYEECTVAHPGEVAEGRLIPGFRVSVDEVTALH